MAHSTEIEKQTIIVTNVQKGGSHFYSFLLPPRPVTWVRNLFPYQLAFFLFSLLMKVD